MAQQLRFDGRVVIVTGSGNGLGREYALFFGSRGAKVVVNDLGTSTSGQGKSSAAADKVVEEIKAAGGEAVANYDSVENGEGIVKTAVDKWGRVDVVINNAGILRDTSFIKMKDADWEIMYKVHLLGAYKVTKAAWPYMRDQKFGRVIMTTSAAGLYGNFGQANYSSMKLAQLGFANSLAIEGAKTNVFTNTIAPVAGSRMTATVMPPDLVEALKPQYIVPLVAYLCHESADVNGAVFEVGAGWVSRVRWQRSQGNFFDLKTFSPEKVREQWDRVNDFANATTPQAVGESIGIITSALEKTKSAATPETAATQSSTAPPESPNAARKGSNQFVDLDKALGFQYKPSQYKITPKEVSLYALAIGCAQEPLDDNELQFVYENHSNFKVFPTMAVVFPDILQFMETPGLTFNPMMLLHGEQYLEIRKPIPTNGTLVTHSKLSALHDKGKNAVALVDHVTKDESGQEICFQQASLFIRGIGGFGGDKGAAGDAYEPPKRAPDAVSAERIPRNNALLYRLCGDLNPLHADPSMAAMGGFDRPILHGLCSLGHAVRAVVRHFCDNNTDRFKSVKVRFSKHVFPGETIVTEMWKFSENQVIFQCKVAERPDAGQVLSNACVVLNHAEGGANGQQQQQQQQQQSVSSNVKSKL